MKIFSEEQKFDQWWFRILMVVILIIIVGATLPIIQEISDDRQTTNIVILAVNILTIAVLVFIGFILTLKTRIDSQGIHYGFYPIRKTLKLIPWKDLEQAHVRKYSPLTEYGGWGYRLKLGSDSKALNVKGNIGIQIVLKTGKKILIGTQKEQEARDIINRYFQKENKIEKY